MFCIQCNQNLDKCTCPDLEERFHNIQQIPQVRIGLEYQTRILAHIHQRKKEKEKSDGTPTN